MTEVDCDLSKQSGTCGIDASKSGLENHHTTPSSAASSVNYFNPSSLATSSALFPNGSSEKHNRMSNENNNNLNGGGDDVCRDFLRNVCHRGANCKFRHPAGSEGEEVGKLVFCHDFQNRECRRPNCRFVHATKQEEEAYRSTGTLPPHVYDRSTGSPIPAFGSQGRGPYPADPYSQFGEPPIPICKDFLKGECRRPVGRCKFRHVKDEIDYPRPPPGPFSNGHLAPPQHRPPVYGSHSAAVYQHPPQTMNGSVFHPYQQGQNASVYPPNAQPAPYRHPSSVNLHATPDNNSPGRIPTTRPYDGYNGPEPKRRAYEGPGGPSPAGPTSAATGESLYSSRARNDTSSGPTVFLEEENSALRRRVEDLKKQVADLMATNEFLLDQNAQLRASGAVTVGFPGAKGLGVPSSAAAAASVAASAAASAQQAVASAVAAAAAAGAAGTGAPVPVPPTSVTLELPVSSLAPLAPVFSVATGLPVSAVSSIAAASAAMNSTQTTPVMSTHASTTYVSYPVMSAPGLRPPPPPPTHPHQMTR